MKIFITAETMLWKPESEALGPYRDDVIIVETSSHRCKDPHGMKVISSGKERVIRIGQSSLEYSDFEGLRNAVAEDESLFKEGEDLIVLADSDPASLIILKVLQADERKKHIHLWATEPFGFEGKWRNINVAELLSDLMGVTSALIDRLNNKVMEVGQVGTPANLFDRAKAEYEKRLPNYLEKINELTYSGFWPTEDEGAFFYDLKKEQFVSTRQDAYDWEEDHFGPSGIHMGMLLGPEYLITDGVSAEEITRPYPRNDGKKVCAKLRELRNEFARANGLDWEEEDCKYDGPCAGTCEHCDGKLSGLDDTAAYIALRNGIDEEDVEIVYPKVEISGFDVQKKSVEVNFDAPPLTMGEIITPYEVLAPDCVDSADEDIYDGLMGMDIPDFLKKENDDE